MYTATAISRRGNPLRSIFRNQPSSSHAHSTRPSPNRNISPRHKQQRHGFSSFEGSKRQQHYVPNRFGTPPPRGAKVWLPRISASVAVLWIAALWGYAATHQEEAPDTGRKRLILYDEKAIAEFEQAQNPLLAMTLGLIHLGERMPGIVLPQDDPRYLAVRRVLDKLLVAYKLDPSEWRLCIDCQEKSGKSQWCRTSWL